jgi:hypothetical protein
MTPYLEVRGGNIEISDLNDPLIKLLAKCGTAEEAAEWLYTNRHMTWMNSSSMDFSDEYGWPTDNARGDVIEALERRRTRDHVCKVCKTCGSEDVWIDANAEWDVEEQCWDLKSTFDAAWCDTCGGETTIIDKRRDK